MAFMQKNELLQTMFKEIKPFILLSYFVIFSMQVKCNEAKLLLNDDRPMNGYDDFNLSIFEDLEMANQSNITIEFEIDLFELFNNVKNWRQIFITIGLIITITGLILNTLSIIVFSKSKIFRNSSFPYYVYVLSIIDSLNLAIRYIVPQLTEKTLSEQLLLKYNATTADEYEIYTREIIDGSYCSALMYLHNSLGFTSTWIMVAISVERWLVIKYPKTTKTRINLRAVIILLSIVVTCHGINMFDFSTGYYVVNWFSNITLLCEPLGLNNDGSTSLTFGLITINAEIFTFSRIILQAIGPFLTALVFNSLIIHNFRTINKAAASHRPSVTVLNSSLSVSNPNLPMNRRTSKLLGSPLFSLFSNSDPHTSTNARAQLNNSSVSIMQQQLQQIQTRKILKNIQAKNKLNRETDFMLIVISFTVLFTQLPCTIAWYLIHYRFILRALNNVYIAAHSPVLIYILRLIELTYFSFNFIFFISLSPSLRREIKKSLPRMFAFKKKTEKGQPLCNKVQITILENDDKPGEKFFNSNMKNSSANKRKAYNNSLPVLNENSSLLNKFTASLNNLS
jgi:hypothetical protein